MELVDELPFTEEKILENVKKKVVMLKLEKKNIAENI